MLQHQQKLQAILDICLISESYFTNEFFNKCNGYMVYHLLFKMNQEVVTQ